MTLGALVVGLAVLAPTVVSAHQESAVRSPQAEKRLQAWERSLLGPTHAAAHAKVRALARATPRQRKLARKAATAGRVRIPWRAKRQHDASIDGNWGAPFPIPVMGIHGAVLPTGKVLWFSYPKNPSRGPGPTPNEGKAWLWDPAKGTGSSAFRDVPPPIFNGVPANIWCAGQTHLADGSILVAGGNLEYSTVSAGFKGLNKMYTFDPFTETWTEQPDMAHGRWYPTLTRLGDGKVVITSGLDETGIGYTNGRNLDIEVFSPPAVRGGVGTLTLTGTRTPGDAGAPGQPPNGAFYPHQFLLPNGKMAVAGPAYNDTWMLDTPGTSTSWTDLPNLDTPGAQWTWPGPPVETFAGRIWGTGVLMPSGLGGTGRIMLAGGTDPGPTGNPPDPAQTRTSTIIDTLAPSPAWQAAPSMNVARSHFQTVLLPDGGMVSVGGGYGTRASDIWAAGDEHRPVELRDPVTGAWRLGAPQAEYRAYHGTAMLLPDGRVVSAGDDFNGGYDTDTAEIYSPPYLFKGPRPIIDAVPDRAAYGQSLGALTSPGVTRAALIAPAAVTHAVDMNQRLIELPVTARADGRGVDLLMPASVNVAPPGYYMLFLMNADGVPAIARWVKLDPAALAPSGPAYPVPVATSVAPSGIAVGGGRQITVDGSAFATTSRVVVGGVERATTYVSTTRLTAELTADDVSDGRVLQVAVTTPAPGGGTSASLSLSVSNPAPTIRAITPSRLTRQSTARTLSVSGSGFVASSRLLWEGAVRPTVVLGPSTLQATLEAADIAAAGVRRVEVRNPEPGGGTSAPQAFAVDLKPLSLALTAPRTARVTSPVRITVRLSRLVRRQRVVLQWRVGTRYVPLAARTVNGRTAVFRVRLTRPGVARLRAVTRESGLLRRSGGRAVTLTRLPAR